MYVSMLSKQSPSAQEKLLAILLFFFFSKTFEYNDKASAPHLLQKPSSFREALHSWSRAKDWKKGMHYEKCIVKNSTLIGFSFLQVAVDAISNTDNLKCNITHITEARTLNPNSNLNSLILTTKSLRGYVSRYFSYGTEKQ